jgi:hypothetical protein
MRLFLAEGYEPKVAQIHSWSITRVCQNWLGGEGRIAEGGVISV